MASLDRVLSKLNDRNFNNDIIGLVSNLRRYKMMDEPINIGDSTLFGSIVEFIFELCDQIDELDEVNRALVARVSNLEEAVKASEDEHEFIPQPDRNPEPEIEKDVFINEDDDEAIVDPEPVVEEKPKTTRGGRKK